MLITILSAVNWILHYAFGGDLGYPMQRRQINGKSYYSKYMPGWVLHPLGSSGAPFAGGRLLTPALAGYRPKLEA